MIHGKHLTRALSLIAAAGCGSSATPEPSVSGQAPTMSSATSGPAAGTSGPVAPRMNNTGLSNAGRSAAATMTMTMPATTAPMTGSAGASTMNATTAGASAMTGGSAAPATPSMQEPTMTAANGCGMPTPNPRVGNTCPGSAPPMLKLTEIARGFESPTFVMQAPGDATRFYVLEQQGTVRVVKDGMLASEPLVDLRDLAGAPVNNSEIIPGSYGEGGLVGGAFDPRFADTKRLWLSYTKGGPAFAVLQFTLDTPDTLDVTKFKELLSFPQYGFAPGGAATNHVGGMLAFGPDGCMYVSRGDGGGENDRQMSGQKTSDDLCSILRIDVDKYPMAAPGNLADHVWSFGFRNPWRFSFDRESGDMYIGDVGQDVGTGVEEINIEPRGVMGRNYGWSVMEGSTRCQGDCSKMTKPAHEYPITNTANSVIGGYVYRGTKIPGLVGRYVWADWTERKIKTLVYKADESGVAQVCDQHDTSITVPLKVRAFAEGLDGEIYVVAGGAPTGGLSSAGLQEAGTLYRIDSI